MYEKKYLVMVNSENNNYKYYQMEADGNELVVSFGRMGGNAQVRRYPLSEWDKKYNEKINKGYKDMSDVYLVEVEREEEPAQKKTLEERLIAREDNLPQHLYNTLYRYTHNMLNEAVVNYKKIANEKMTTQGREILGNMYDAKSVKEFNDYLLELIAISPRKAPNVDALLAKTKDDFPRIIEREDDLIDAMEVIVNQEKIKKEALKKEKEARKKTEDSIAADESLETLPDDLDMFDLLGIDVWVATDEQRQEVLKHLSTQLQPKVKRVYRVINKEQKQRFDDYVKETGITEIKQLFHGSRNENWLSIIDNGLLLKPNAVITGKMFGNGIYFAPSSMKSWNYTSYHGSYWAKGNDTTAFMGLYATAYGTPYNVDDWSNEDYETSVKKGKYNCLHAHAGKSLRNDEIIFYTESAMLLNYIIEFGD